MSDSDSDCQMDIDAVAEMALAGLLPDKSKALYENAFKKFEEWRAKYKILIVDEKCMLAYFSQELGNHKPSTKWTIYSMLKTTLNMKMGKDISNFKNLIAFLKRKSDGYRPKKSRILTKEQIFTYLQDANDENHLLTKVALIVGVYGACRRDEIFKLSLADIDDMGDSVKITIPNTKTKILRQFVITKGNAAGIDMLKFFREYAKLRPADTNHSRFFVGYRLGKCTKQAVDINTIAKMPRSIAEFLKLPAPEEYTGHCFRRSSASLLADTGVDMSVLKRHGGWKSSTVAEGYVENSLEQKKMIAGKILNCEEVPKQTEPPVDRLPENPALPTIDIPDDLLATSRPSSSSANAAPSTPNPAQFNHLTNCTINFYQK